MLRLSTGRMFNSDQFPVPSGKLDNRKLENLKSIVTVTALIRWLVYSVDAM